MDKQEFKRLTEAAQKAREDARLENIRTLIDNEHGGNKARMADVLHMTPGEVSRMVGPNPTRSVTEFIARTIEFAYGLETYVLDKSTDGKSLRSGNELSRLNPDARRLVASIMRLDYAQSAPKGFFSSISKMVETLPVGADVPIETPSKLMKKLDAKKPDAKRRTTAK